MSLTPDITISQLLKDRKIARRVFTVCESLGIKTLEDLMELDENVLLNCRNCGVTTINQIQELRKETDGKYALVKGRSDYMALVQHAFANLAQNNEKISSTLKSAENVGRLLMLPIMRLNCEVNSICKQTADNIKTQDIFSLLYDLTQDLLNNLFLPIDLVGIVQERANEIKNFYKIVKEREFQDNVSRGAQRVPMDFSEAEEGVSVPDLSQLPIIVQDELENRYVSNFDSCSTRVKNKFIIYRDFQRALQYMFSNIHVENTKGLGPQSLEEFDTMIYSFKEDLLLKLHLYTDGCAGSHDDLMECGKLYMERHLSFLEEKDKEWILQLLYSNQQLPTLYIIKRYIEKSDSHMANIHRKCYGICDGTEPLNNNVTVAKETGYCPERVRQLMRQALPLPDFLQKLWAEERQLITTPVLSADSNEIQSLKEKNYNLIDADRILGIIGSLDNEYHLMIYDARRVPMLIKKHILSQITIGAIFTDLTVEHAYQTADIRVFDIRQIVIDALPKEHTLKDFEIDILAKEILHYYLKMERTEQVGEFGLEIHPGRLNIILQLEKILERKGVPTTTDELIEEFNRRYPENSFHSRNYFRSYINRSRRVRSIGKTGLYALKEWDGIYTGTMTQYIYERLIAAKGTPVSAEKLAKELSELFRRDMNKYRVISLISVDAQRRFKVWNKTHIRLLELPLPASTTLDL